MYSVSLNSFSILPKSCSVPISRSDDGFIITRIPRNSILGNMFRSDDGIFVVRTPVKEYFSVRLIPDSEIFMPVFLIDLHKKLPKTQVATSDKQSF